MAQDEAKTTPRRAALLGLLWVAPTSAMIAPFGVLSGAISAESGLDIAQTLTLSALVFAGASQLATIELLRAGAPILVIVATGLAINLRFTMYAASLAPWLRAARTGPRMACAALLVDNVYAISILWFRQARGADVWARVVFYLSAAVFTWTLWQIATVIGFGLGAALPPEWSLDFAAPIAFLALAMPMLRGKPAWIAAAVAAALAIALKDLPYNSGVLVASLVAIGAALAAETVIGAPEREASSHD